MPRHEKPVAILWRDCQTCGWRNYPLANENPATVTAFVQTTWAPAERCGGCGQPLHAEQVPNARAVGAYEPA